MQLIPLLVLPSDVFPLVSNQPFELLNFSPEIIPCGSVFKANPSTSNNTCPTSKEGGKPNNVHLMVLLVALGCFILGIIVGLGTSFGRCSVSSMYNVGSHES